MVLDQPSLDSGGVSRQRSVAVAVGCLHFNGTFYFGIVASIHIGQEIQCLPHDFFVLFFFSFLGFLVSVS